MVKLDRSPLNYPVNQSSAINRYMENRAPAATDYKNFIIGDEWLNSASNDWYKLSGKTATSGTWVLIGGTGGAAEGIQGDTGGVVNPDITNVIYFDGNTNGMQITGIPVSNELTFLNLRNTTSYVVDPTAGATEYQTIQAAIDAAAAVGFGTVYIRPGIYNEDLVLYDAVDLVGSVATPAMAQVAIVGTHTPPLVGSISIRNILLSDTINILDSADAGTTTIAFIDCMFAIDNGVSINLPNWTGLIGIFNCHCIGTLDGFIDIGAGAADAIILGSTIGNDPSTISVFSGTARINDTNIQCSLNMVDNGVLNMRACQWSGVLLFTEDSLGTINNSFCYQDVATAINHTATGSVDIYNTAIYSSGNPDVITGTGLINLGSCLFPVSAAINAGITKTVIGREETGPIHIGPGATTPTVHVDVVDTVAGGIVGALYFNEDNTNAASDSLQELLVGGVNAGDPYVKFAVLGTQSYSMGIDNSDADILCITDGASPSAGNEMWRMTTAGERTMSLQPAFLGYLAATANNKTGNGTVYQLGTDALTEVYDQNNDFNVNGTFTAPVSGKYLLTAAVGLTGCTINTLCIIYITTSNRTYQTMSVRNASAFDNSCRLSVIADMDAADTATVSVMGNGEAGDTDDVIGGVNPFTFFSGSLIC